VLTIVFAYTARWVGFEPDLTRMNYMPDKLKEAESRLRKINMFSLQSVYLVSEGKDINDALINNEKMITKVDGLKEKGIVKKYSAVSSLIISDSLQKARIERWDRYWSPEKKNQLIALLKTEGVTLGFRPSAFDPFTNLLNTKFQPVDITAM